MIINKVSLSNFGIYRGLTTLDFSVKENHPVILIGGENGSGKTTLLTAIKIALYGSSAFGFKSINESYKSIIRDKVNKYAVTDQKGKITSIVEVEIVIEDRGELNTFRVTRQWNVDSSEISETLSIRKNKKPLTDKEASDFQNYLRKFFPPTLFDFFLFDGEQIHQLVNNEEFLVRLKDAFFTLFDLDNVETLQIDLHNYLKQDNVFSSLSSEEKEHTLISGKCEEVKSQITTLKRRYIEIQTELRNTENANVELEREFKVHGGVQANERDRLLQEIANLERDKRVASEHIKDGVASLLPFALCKELLLVTKEQIDADRQKAATNDSLDFFRNKLSEAFSLTISKNDIQITRSEQDFREEFILDLINELKLSSPSSTDTILHDMSNQDYLILMSLIQDVLSFNNKSYIQLFKRINTSNQKISQIRKQIELNSQNSAFQQILDQISSNHELIGDFQIQLELTKQEIHSLSEELTQLEVELVKVQKRLNQAQRDESVFVLCKKIVNVLREFSDQAVRSKVKEFERHFLSIFNALNRKESFIHSVILDHTSFRVTIFDGQGLPVAFTQLSAGEKQLYILSLVWALLKTSRRTVPLVFDTLLGRLDRTHKEKILTKLIPNISEQVLILSTDSEIDEYYYEIVSPQISQQYQLDYDKDQKTVAVSEKYFLLGSVL